MVWKSSTKPFKDGVFSYLQWKEWKKYKIKYKYKFSIFHHNFYHIRNTNYKALSTDKVAILILYFNNHGGPKVVKHNGINNFIYLLSFWNILTNRFNLWILLFPSKPCLIEAVLSFQRFLSCLISNSQFWKCRMNYSLFITVAVLH